MIFLQLFIYVEVIDTKKSKKHLRFSYQKKQVNRSLEFYHLVHSPCIKPLAPSLISDNVEVASLKSH